jgi:hypothetical protein
MRTFQQQLDMVRQLGLQAVQEIVIDLSVAAADQEYNLSGNFFYVNVAPDQEVYVAVKINGSNNKAINWTKQMGFIHPYNRLYITTPTGQTGTMKILIASEAPELFNVVDNRSAISDATTGIYNELRGDTTPEVIASEKTVGSGATVQLIASNANRKGCTVQAKSTNTGIVYIGFYGSGPYIVTSTKWVAELQAGMAFSIDDYRGDIYAIASAAGQLVGGGEW